MTLVLFFLCTLLIPYTVSQVDIPSDDEEINVRKCLMKYYDMVITEDTDLFDIRQCLGEPRQYCYKINPGRELRITEGQKAKRGELPFVVKLFISYKNEIDEKHVTQCGASLITKYHILTAAHCVAPEVYPGLSGTFGSNNYRLEEWVAVAGLPNINLLDVREKNLIGHIYDGQPGDIIRHPKYTGPNVYDFDAAILIPARAASLGHSFPPACLPGIFDEQRLFAIKLPLVVTGYGYVKDTSVPSALYKFPDKVLDTRICKKHRILVTENKFCTSEKDANTCKVDDGGPVLMINERGEVIQVGIIGFQESSRFECKATRPVSHTSVIPLMPWIKQVLFSGVEVPEFDFNS